MKTIFILKLYFLQCHPCIPIDIDTSWFSDKLLPSLIGALIGASSALLIFYLTTRSDKKKELKKTETDRQDKIAYLKSLLNSVVNVAKHQKRNYEEHVAKIHNDDIEFQEMAFVPLTDFVRAIQALSKEEYYSAFIKVYDRKFDCPKRFNQLISNIDFLHAEFVEVPEILGKSQKFDYERKVKYKETMEKTSSMIEKYLLNQSNAESPLYKSTLKIFSEFNEKRKDRYDISEVNEKFIIPLNGVFADFINKYVGDLTEEVYIMAYNIRELRNLYLFIKDSNKRIADDLKEINKQVESSINELVESVKLL